jgi:Sulfotransferase domain
MSRAASVISHTKTRHAPVPSVPKTGYLRGRGPTSILSSFFRRPKVDRVDFIVAGVQKAGTTAIHDFFAQHPEIALLRDQALHFFDKEENFGPSRTGALGAPDYRILHGNFDPGWRWRTAGEVTADYLYYPRALDRIAAYNPRMKVIISLRNPTERAFSQWNMRREKNQEPLEFLDALKRDQEIGLAKNPRGNAYIARSLYAPQLEKVFALFPREQVFLTKYESFRANPFPIVDQLFDFLGLAKRAGLKNKQRNVGSYSRKLTAQERACAAAIFADDIASVEKLLGWDCSDWRCQSTLPTCGS